MATYTIDLTATKTATVDSDNPNTNYSTGNTTTITSTRTALFGFGSMPSTINGRRIKQVILRGYKTAATWPSGTFFWGRWMQYAWEEATATYNTVTDRRANNYLNSTYPSEPTNGYIEAATEVTPYQESAQIIRNIIQGTGLMAYPSNFDGSITLNTSRAASNKPVMRIIAEDVQPAVSNPSPTGGAYCNPNATNTFTWTTADTAGATYHIPNGIQTTGSKFRYRLVGGSYTEVTLANNARSYNLASGLTAGHNYEWQVVETTADGVSTTSAWYPFATIDVTPNKPVLLYPNLDYVQIDQDITFEWQHVIDTGTAQTKADLQYSYAGGTFQTLATVTGSSYTVTIAADTLPAGNLRWRARTYNNDNVAGDWSGPVAFVGIGTPAAPTISSITNASRPVVAWQSTGQVSYRLQAVQDGNTIYDTFETAGAAKTHKIVEYLANGMYAVRVAIKNASLEWSPYTEQSIIISVVGPATPSITATAITDGVRLAFTATDAAKLYLFRNSVVVADVTGLTSYVDYAALGPTRYALRAADGSDNYSDSTEVFIDAAVMHAKLAAVDALDETVSLILTRGEPKRIAGRTSRSASQQFYIGHELPTTTFSGFKSIAYTVPVAFLSTTDKDALTNLLNRRQTLLYRDSYGNRWFVTIADDDSEQDHIATSQSLQMTLVHYDEKIEYGA